MNKFVQLSFSDYLAMVKDLEATLPGNLKEAARNADQVLAPGAWSSEEVGDLHRGLLEVSLRQLKSEKTSRATKEDILKWLKRPLLDDPLPFSFQACCILLGLDAEEMQTQVLFIMRKHLH